MRVGTVTPARFGLAATAAIDGACQDHSRAHDNDMAAGDPSFLWDVYAVPLGRCARKMGKARERACVAHLSCR